MRQVSQCAVATKHTQTHVHARTHACMHARTHARTHAHVHIPSSSTGDSGPDEDKEVPDWAAGHYYALDGSVASYASECRRDPYRKFVLLEA